MNVNPDSPALTPALVEVRPDFAPALPENRRWQGIASLERSPGGRLYVVFYTGGEDEGPGNFAIAARSLDDGLTFEDPYLAVRHPDPQTRVFDPNLFTAPDGRLFLFWAQSLGRFDGRCGVWCSVCENPDEDDAAWSAPQRVANGVMMNKPLVLADGTWLLPCAVWVCRPPLEDHPELAGERFSNVYASTDGGHTFALRGGADVKNRCFDEHMVAERRDGSLLMLVRRYDGLGSAVSADGGFTWTGGGHAGIPGPDSRFFLRRLASGGLLLVNHVDFRGRNNLTAQLSWDDGKTFQGGLVLDERDDVSYPDGVQAPDGRVYIAYDHDRYGQREVLMAVFTQADILAGRPVSPQCRLRVPVSRATGPLPERA